MTSPDFVEPDFVDNPIQELETNLAAQIPGLRLLDRQIELDIKRGVAGRVDFAGVDGDGRMVMVLLVDLDGDTAALGAIDLYVVAQRHSALLARHMDLDPESACPPRLILVAEAFDDLFLARLQALGNPFELLSIETLRSERGARSYLVPHFGVSGTGNRPSEAVSQEAFLAGMSERQRVPAELLVSRLARMDSEVKVRFEQNNARWTFQGHEFLGLRIVGEELVGFVLPVGDDHMLDSVEGVESLVESAFGAYVRLIGIEPYELPKARPSKAFESQSPLLSAEEIAAFQA